MTECIFCKIIKKEIQTTKIYEDERTFAFLDISPVNYGHALVIPKVHSENLLEMKEKDLTAVMKTVQKIANAIMKGLKADGFNLGMNNYPAAGQLVMHSHIHVMPRLKNDGLRLNWPNKKYANGMDKDVAETIIKHL